jgi:hypothetical protein
MNPLSAATVSSAAFGCVAGALLMTACDGGVPVDDAGPALPPPAEIASPAGPGSGQPFLFSDGHGPALLSWIEPSQNGHALRLATLEGDAWSEPLTVQEGDDWFVNWADFPSIHRLDDGTLAAHWLQRTGASTYAYGVRIAFSHDGGKTWSPAVTPHRDSTDTEHGFVSLYPAGAGIGAVWLDGRNAATHAADASGHGADFDMMLRSATILPDGSLVDEHVVDARTCECCQTDVAVAGSGPVVVYRDRSPEEIRDIHIAALRGGAWSAPTPVHQDGWRIEGCPVNGPAVAAAGDRVAVAWYTIAADTARVRLALSQDGGRTFGPPVRVDDGDPEGRVDVLLLDDGAALVSWLERGDSATVRARTVAANGARSASVVVAGTSAARNSGFPRMALTGGRIVFAWTETGEPSRVRVAMAVLPDSRP